jgi:PmbA protein
MAQLLSSAKRAVRLAEKWGATEAEAYVSHTVQNSLTFHEKIETAKTSQIMGIGLRAAVDKRIGFSSTSSIEPKDLEKTVKMAVAIAKASQPDLEWHSLPSSTGKASAERIFDKKTAEIETDTLAAKSIEIADLVQNRDNRLSPARGTIATTKMMCTMANSHGVQISKKGTYALFSIRVKAEDIGKTGTGNEGCETRSWKAIDFENLTEEASRRAVRSLNALPIPSAKKAVIFTNDVFARILDIMFTGTINAEAIQRRRSPWFGRIGQQIAQDTFNVVDDGTMKEGIMSWGFDDEGVPQRETQVIEKGILRSYLYDTYTANKDGVTSTGNARRSRLGTFNLARPYTRTPVPAPTNFVLKKGNARKDELIEDTKEGILVLNTIGEWLSNSLSGALNVTVTNGVLVRNGELSDPVKGVIVSGNFFEMIRNNIDLVADDIRNDGSFYSPSVRVQQMSVAGK